MANVPDELQRAPPRDPVQGSDVYSDSTFSLKAAALATAIMLPAIVVKNLRSDDPFDALDPSMLVGYLLTVGGLVITLTLLVRWMRIRSLYREGVLVQGLIETLRFDRVSPAEVRATMDVRYTDAQGQPRQRRLAIKGVLGENQVRQGGPLVMLVHPTRSNHVGVYTMMTGLVIP